MAGSSAENAVKFKKGIDESILKPGFSINPQKVAARPVSQDSSEQAATKVNVETQQESQSTTKSYDELLKEIIERYKNQLRSNIAIWLMKLSYNVEENSLHILVDTRTQESELATEKPNILYHFRHGLNNPRLEMKIEMKELDLEAMAAQRSLTPQEKLNVLKEKNKMLEEFLTQFDLKLE